MQELREELDLWFGFGNEMKLAVVQVVTTKPPKKPTSLRSLEQCEAFGALPQEGGIDDQSYIWLQAVRECIKVRNLHEMASKRVNAAIGL